MNVERHYHSLFFNGVDLADYGVHISGGGTFNSPEYDYEVVEVPGKSGDLLINRNRFKNVQVSYDAWIGENLDLNLQGLRNVLLGSRGYKRLEDTYHPDEYRLAYFTGPLDVDAIQLLAGEFTLDFECKPQRFLKLGEQVIRVNRSTDQTYSLYNHTYNESKPLLRVYGTGELQVLNETRNFTMTVSAHSGIPYIDIDCDLCDCHYLNTTNCNRYVAFSNNKFPVFDPGVITVSLGSGITRVDITPRWFTV